MKKYLGYSDKFWIISSAEIKFQSEVSTTGIQVWYNGPIG